MVVIYVSFFFFNDTATTEIYTLSLHDALPIYLAAFLVPGTLLEASLRHVAVDLRAPHVRPRAHEINRSEEHTSELQSRPHIVCRLLLEKKNNTVSIGLGVGDFTNTTFLYLDKS